MNKLKELIMKGLEAFPCSGAIDVDTKESVILYKVEPKVFSEYIDQVIRQMTDEFPDSEYVSVASYDDEDSYSEDGYDSYDEDEINEWKRIWLNE